MSWTEYFIACACLGLGTAIAGWIWPFRRGWPGIATNAVVSVIGAMTVGWLLFALRIPRTSKSPLGLMAASLGALLFISILHLVWNRADRRGRGGQMPTKGPTA